MIKNLLSIALIVFISSCAEQKVTETEDTIDARLAIELTRLGFKDGMPELPPVFGPYLPYLVVDKEIYITASAAYTPQGTWITGLVTNETDPAHVLYAAELSVIQAINRIRLAAGGDLNNVAKLHHVIVMTTAPEDYPHTEMVAQATSDMIIRIMGPEVGAHTRSILRSTSLPINMTHETEIRSALK